MKKIAQSGAYFFFKKLAKCQRDRKKNDQFVDMQPECYFNWKPNVDNFLPSSTSSYSEYSAIVLNEDFINKSDLVLSIFDVGSSHGLLARVLACSSRRRRFDSR